MNLQIINENQFADMFLNEERHYPQFLDTLKSNVVIETIKEINKQIRAKTPKFQFIFNANCEYCKNIIINVVLDVNGDIENPQEYHAEYYNSYEELICGKLYNPQINLFIPINGRKYSYGKLSYVLSHELTHLYDDWMSLMNGKEGINYQEGNVATTSTIKTLLKNGSDLYKGIAILSYMSLKVERQAFLSQTVQELESVGCGRFNYKEKLKELTIYKNITKSYKLFNNGLKYVDDSSLYKLNMILMNDSTKSNIPKYDIKVFSPQQYRAKLRRWADNIYHQTMKRYGSVVSYYVDKLNEDYYDHNCLYVI